MILGNSRTNRNSFDRVKKYTRLNGDEVLTVEGAIRIALFNSWITDCYSNLTNKIKAKYEYDKDVFHDTYIRIFESVGYKELDIIDFDNYFFRAYFTNLYLKKVMGTRLYLCSTDQELYDYADKYNRSEKQSNYWFSNTFEKILSELPRYFTRHEIVWFKLSSGVYDSGLASIKKYTYSELAFMYGVQEYTIQYRVSSIKRHINKFYSNLYKSRL